MYYFIFLKKDKMEKFKWELVININGNTIRKTFDNKKEFDKFYKEVIWNKIEKDILSLNDFIDDMKVWIWFLADQLNTFSSQVKKDLPIYKNKIKDEVSSIVEDVLWVVKDKYKKSNVKEEMLSKYDKLKEIIEKSVSNKKEIKEIEETIEELEKRKKEFENDNRLTEEAKKRIISAIEEDIQKLIKRKDELLNNL